MEFLKQLSNIGSSTNLTVQIFFFIGIMFLFIMFIKSIIKYSETKNNVSLKQTIIYLSILTFSIIIIYFGFGSGEYKPETVEVDEHSLNSDIMKSDTMLTKDEIEKDVIYNMDSELKAVRIDSVRVRVLRDAEKETDRELERISKLN